MNKKPKDNTFIVYKICFNFITHCQDHHSQRSIIFTVNKAPPVSRQAYKKKSTHKEEIIEGKYKETCKFF